MTTTLTSESDNLDCNVDCNRKLGVDSGGSSMKSSKAVSPRNMHFIHNRWLQLVVGIVGMIAIANLQYGWTLFVAPIDRQYHWGTAAIQVAFTLFVLTETWLVPVEAYFVDRFGPSLIVGLGGILVGSAWVINSWASTLAWLYVGGIVGGLGSGIVYGTASGSALKWFPDRRGLAAGLTAAGFGAGSALTVLPIANQIQNSGYHSAFFTWGLVQGTVVLICALLLRRPEKGKITQIKKPAVQQTARDFTPIEMLKTPTFWLLYAMFAMVATGGLMATAQLGPIARDFKVANIPVNLFGLTLAALPFALSLDRIMNGFTRPLFGWISDHIGRENTMAFAFGLEGLAILGLISFAHIPEFFVILSGLAFFAWGEIFSLFPALSGDLFGQKFATTNYGLLYTAKGTASLLVPIASLIVSTVGTWLPVFMVAIAFDWTAALLALVVLKPLRIRWLSALHTDEQGHAERVAATPPVVKKAG
jgi:OFA family oxalate/formate antiporter-like MFS transporter